MKPGKASFTIRVSREAAKSRRAVPSSASFEDFFFFASRLRVSPLSYRESCREDSRRSFSSPSAKTRRHRMVFRRNLPVAAPDRQNRLIQSDRILEVAFPVNKLLKHPDAPVIVRGDSYLDCSDMSELSRWPTCRPAKSWVVPPHSGPPLHLPAAGELSTSMFDVPSPAATLKTRPSRSIPKVHSLHHPPKPGGIA